MLDPNNFNIVLDFIGEKGSQFIYLPKSLRRNTEIIQRAVESINSDKRSGIRSAYYDSILNNELSEKRKEQREMNEISLDIGENGKASDKKKVSNFILFINDDKSYKTINKIKNIISENYDALNNIKVASSTYEKVFNMIKELFHQNYITDDEYKSVIYLERFYAYHTNRPMLNNGFWSEVSSYIISKIKSEDDANDLIRYFVSINTIKDDVYKYFNVSIIGNEFIAQTFDIAVQCALRILDMTERILYANSQLNDLDGIYNGEIKRNEMVIDHARELVEKSLNSRNFSWFSRLDYIFGFSSDPTFMKSHQNVQFLFGRNWYRSIKTSKIKVRNWYKEPINLSEVVNKYQTDSLL